VPVTTTARDPRTATESDLEVQVRAGGGAGRAHPADRVTSADDLAHRDENLALVGVAGGQLLLADDAVF
jgi:hypothetical protein